MEFRMPDSYYDPPEPTPCCAEWEDDEDHDSEACLAEQAEAWADKQAEDQRERESWADYDC